MSTNLDKHEEPDLYALAADWHTRMDDPNAGPVDRAELDVWLHESPEHAASYRAIERMWDNTRKMATDPRILQFRHEALAAVATPGAGGARKSWFAFLRALGEGVGTKPLRFLATTSAIVAAVGAALLGPPAWRQYGHAERPMLAGQKLDAGIFTTAVGERSTVSLSDGSSVVLDTQSRIDVAYSAAERHIRLVSGQAWFQVAHSPGRPFIVDAGDRRITALGTAFDVRLGNPEKSVQVTLAEGRVAVEAIQSPLGRLIESTQPPSVLTPGDSLVVSDARPVVSHQADVAKIAGWRQGQLIFEGDTLAAAVAEMNRYSGCPIVLADPSLANLPVSGVFQAGHSRSFIETVTGYYPIVVSQQADGCFLLTPKQPVGSP